LAFFRQLLKNNALKAVTCKEAFSSFDLPFHDALFLYLAQHQQRGLAWVLSHVFSGAAADSTQQ
jgi:hypothetical protein